MGPFFIFKCAENARKIRGKYAESTRSADAYSPCIVRAERARGKCAENTRRMRVSPRDIPQAYHIHTFDPFLTFWQM